METIKVAKLEEDAILSTRKYSSDAGMDLYAYGDHIIKPHMFEVIRTGITVEIPDNFVGQIWPKSGSNFLIGGGIVDQGYQGEILVKVMNTLSRDIVIGHGQAVAQLVLVDTITPAIKEVSKDRIHTKETLRAATGGIVDQTFTATSPIELVDESIKLGKVWD